MAGTTCGVTVHFYSLIKPEPVSLCQLPHAKRFVAITCSYVCKIIMLNKDTWGVYKKVWGHIANRQAQPKVLISAEAKKSLYQNVT